jgi:hypothetical protein
MASQRARLSLGPLATIPTRSPMNVLRCAVIALSLCTFPVAAQESERFVSATAGFSLNKPAGWRFVSREDVNKSRANVRLSDEELQKALDQQKATAPLVAMIKHVEPSGGPGPDFQVTLVSRHPALADASPKQILELVLPTLQKGYPDFALESPIREFEFAGHAAAEYVATYTLRTKVRAQGGSVFPVRGRLIVVPRGKFFFLIGMVAPREDYDRSNEEYAKILSSITIDQ